MWCRCAEFHVQSLSCWALEYYRFDKQSIFSRQFVLRARGSVQQILMTVMQ